MGPCPPPTEQLPESRHARRAERLRLPEQARRDRVRRRQRLHPHGRVSGRSVRRRQSGRMHRPTSATPPAAIPRPASVRRPRSAGACNPGAFDYDKAGRLIRDRGAELRYDGYDQLREVVPMASPPPITTCGRRPGDARRDAGPRRSCERERPRSRDGRFASGGYRTPAARGTASPGFDRALGMAATTLFASGMNDANAVAGTWSSGAVHPRLPVRPERVPRPRQPGDFTVAYDMNDANQVVGRYRWLVQCTGYRHSDATGFEEIRTLGGAQSWAWWVDDLGTVAASAQMPNSPSTGFARFGHAALYKTSSAFRTSNAIRRSDCGHDAGRSRTRRKATGWSACDEGESRAYRLNSRRARSTTSAGPAWSPAIRSTRRVTRSAGDTSRRSRRSRPPGS